MLFYGGALFVIALVISVMTVCAARHPELLTEGVTMDDLRQLKARVQPAPPFYIAILDLALLAPRGAV